MNRIQMMKISNKSKKFNWDEMREREREEDELSIFLVWDEWMINVYITIKNNENKLFISFIIFFFIKVDRY